MLQKMYKAQQSSTNVQNYRSLLQGLIYSSHSILSTWLLKELHHVLFSIPFCNSIREAALTLLGLIQQIRSYICQGQWAAKIHIFPRNLAHETVTCPKENFGWRTSLLSYKTKISLHRLGEFIFIFFETGKVVFSSINGMLTTFGKK